ncbi:hypothetical protein FRB98_003131 [Tulasnella sp. 332]|nr:hypothetical protein FRB98_003131 [Tulasnella sp. 332]
MPSPSTDDLKPPNLDEPQKFGDAGNFWVRYEGVATEFDKDTMKQLNGNLDVLLIFAGLFSATNTAFIVPSLNNLGAGPADQTNHLIQLLLVNGTNKDFTPAELTVSPFVPSRAAVRQNSLFIASLGCSLLAAAGAVLAKQWLQYYKRAGTTGPIRDQGMKRTKKFIGAEKWGLVHVVESLPGLLLVSVALFVAALVDYLWEVHRSVAIIFLAFGAPGTFAFMLTVLLGAVDETCPFQTSFSSPLRSLILTGRGLFKYAKEIRQDPHLSVRTAIVSWGRILGQFRWETGRWLSRTWARILRKELQVVSDILWVASQPVIFPIATGFTWIYTGLRQVLVWGKDGLEVDEEEWISAHSAVWMAEATPELDNMIMIAQNLPLARRLESLELISRSQAFPGLLHWFRLSLLALREHHRKDSNLENAITLAGAIAHIVLADPYGGARMICKLFENIGNLEWLVELCGKGSGGFEALMIHLLAIARVFPKSPSQQSSERLLVVDASFRQGLKRCNRTGAAATTHLRHFILDAPFNRRRWGDTRCKIDEIGNTLSTNENENPVYVICASWALSLTLRASRIFRGESLDKPPLPLGDEASVWAVREGASFADRLIDVLEAFSQYYANARRASPSQEIDSRLLGCQKQLLIHARTLNLSNDIMLQRGEPDSEGLFRKMHRALNGNIRELFQMDHKGLYPPIDAPALQDCLNTLVDSLRELLLTPAAQWSEFDLSNLRITALHGREVALKPKHAELAEGILYRYFAYHSIYAGLGRRFIKDERRMKLSRDRRIGPVLVSALRLYLGLYPSATLTDIWPIFSSYLLFLATGHLQTGDPRICAIDLIPSIAAVLPESPPRMGTRQGIGRTLTLSAGLDFRRRLPGVSTPLFDGALDDEAKVAKTAVDVCRGPAAVEWPGWTDTATIEAFATWLPTLDSTGKIAIMDEGADIIMLQTTVDLNHITTFLDQASSKNLEAVKQFDLDSISQKTRMEITRTEMNMKQAVLDTPNSPQSVPEPSGRPNQRNQAFEWMLTPFTPSRQLDTPLPDDLVSIPVPTAHPALQLSVLTPWEAIRSGMSCCLIGTARRRPNPDMWKIKGEARVDNPEGANAAWLDNFLNTLLNGHILPRPVSSDIVDTDWTSFTWNSPADLYTFYNAWLQSRPAQYNFWRVVPYAGPGALHQTQTAAVSIPQS